MSMRDYNLTVNVNKLSHSRRNPRNIGGQRAAAVHSCGWFSLLVVLVLSWDHDAVSAFTVSTRQSTRPNNPLKSPSTPSLPQQQPLRHWAVPAEADTDSVMDEYDRQMQAFLQTPSSDSNDAAGHQKSSVPRRVKTRLSSLLSGVPSLSELFRAADAEEEEEEQQEKPTHPAPKAKEARRRTTEEAWFAATKQDIQAKYDTMLAEMQSKLELERRNHPNAVPENAPALMTDIFKEEMQEEVTETYERMLEERMQRDEEEVVRQGMDEDDVGDELKIILEETEEEFQKKKELQQRAETFIEYEQQEITKAEEETALEAPPVGTNMDLWLLDRLENMADKNLEDDNQLAVDLLEDSAENLRKQMEKEASEPKLGLRNMKEWQMYRSILTRLEKEANEGLGPSSDSQSRQQEALRQLQAWREFVHEEDAVRDGSRIKAASMTSYETERLNSFDQDEPVAGQDSSTEIELKRDMNRKSIKALEDLLQTANPSRRDELKNEIEDLRSYLESNDYLDVGESLLDVQEQSKTAGPVDVSDLFMPPISPPRRVSGSKQTATNPIPELAMEKNAEDQSIVTSKQEPEIVGSLPAESNSRDSIPGHSKLGTYEEQKIKSMFRKAKARSKSEQEALKKGYEEFKRLEEESRRKTGLSSAGPELPVDELNFDATAFLLGNGDIDADRVLQVIGPRPSRKKAKGLTSTNPDSSEVSKHQTEELDSLNEEGGAALTKAPSDNKPLSTSTSIDRNGMEIPVTTSDEMKSSRDEHEMKGLKGQVFGEIETKDTPKDKVSELQRKPYLQQRRVGLFLDDHYDDGDLPEKTEKDDSLKALKANLLEYTELEVAGLNYLMDHKDSVYSTGLSPYQPLVNKPFSCFGAIFRLEGVLVDMTDLQSQTWKQVAEQFGLRTPSHEDIRRAVAVRPEIAVKEMFLLSNDVLLIRNVVSVYRKIFRQTFDDWAKLHGMSLPTRPTDGLVLGAELINTKEQVDSPNNGELVGSSMNAWIKTAEMHGKNLPSQAELFRAASTNPQGAIMDVFHWTNNADEASLIVETYNSCMSAGLPKLSEIESAESMPLEPTIAEDMQSFGSDITPEDGASGVSEEEFLKGISDAWTTVALEIGEDPPSEEQVLRALSAGSEEAVVSVFGWANDASRVSRIVEMYVREVSDLQKRQETGLKPPPPQSTPQPEERPLSVASLPGAHEWVKLLQEVEMPCIVVSYLDYDQVNFLLAQTGLADLFPVENRVTASNGYKDDIQQLLGAALRAERRPDHCVVFDCTPYASEAAHENGMRSVNLIGSFPKYELLTAEATMVSFNEMAPVSIRRLFSDSGSDQPETESFQPREGTRRQVLTRVRDDE